MISDKLRAVPHADQSSAKSAIDVRTPSTCILSFAFYCPQAVESSHIELLARRRQVGDYQFVMQIAYRTLHHPTRGAFLDWLPSAAHCARTPCPFRLNLPYTLSPQKKQQVRSHTQIFFPSRRRSLPLKLSFLHPLNPPFNAKFKSIDETEDSASLRQNLVVNGEKYP